ncbi:transcriptional regulator, TetR family [Aliiroseovarius halocynthiae]|uniref:TetR/AcrR family transcriptional regulator n=2 Tax=Aliiroseovarius halocynthiae TaxID=985055 RepID=A0A545SLR0_9RHOB|nr:TetR/AcrR family transcriptional regulator [Aliiroseovarius halocynthiae]SMR83543.1 transcriptional regulator, TetR family [Aliiroseovarius halocynthiae]
MRLCALAESQNDLMKNPQLTPRKEAQQARSRKKVEKILSVTRALLTAGPAHQITTIGIAERAGISVGSLYQFFPNKEAIFYELFRQWLSETVKTLDRVKDSLPDDATKEDCVDAFLTALSDPKLNSLENWKLRMAMGLTPELAKLEEQHIHEVTIRIFELQKRFGNPPPDKMMADLMVLQNEITVRCLFSLAFLEKSPNHDVLFDLCKKLMMLIYDYPSWSGLGSADS